MESKPESKKNSKVPSACKFPVISIITRGLNQYQIILWWFKLKRDIIFESIKNVAISKASRISLIIIIPPKTPCGNAAR